MDNLFSSIDIYCERLGAGIGAEPVNALTNAAFLLAAWLLWKDYRQSALHDARLVWLIAMVAAIGLGSGMFHVFANRLTVWMDILPITVFLLSYIAIFLRMAAGQKYGMTALWLAGFLLLSWLSGVVPPPYRLNGTIAYVPALIYLLGMAAYLSRQKIRHDLWLAPAMFIFSMTMRSLDMALCHALPLGTHFLWHVSNGVVLYLAVRSLMRLPPREPLS